MEGKDFVVRNMTNKIIKMLEVSKGNIENIIHDLPNIVAIIKSNGIIFSGNSKLSLLMNVPHENLIRENFKNLFGSENWENFQTILQEIQSTQKPKEFSLETKNQNQKYNMATTYLWDVHLYKKELRSKEKLFLIIGKDITEITHHQKELKKINANLESIVEERTAKLKQKTKDVANMLQNMKQGIFTILPNKTIHSEYSRHLEEIFKTKDIAGKNALNFLFSQSNLGPDILDQIDSALFNSLEQDLLSFQINEELFIKEFQFHSERGTRFMELDWNPIVNEEEHVEKILVNVKDVTELKQLQLDMGAKKRELEIIGEILHVSTKKFLNFTENALQLIDENKKIVQETKSKNPKKIQLLFRNMHTVKGNARTYELRNLTDVIHEVEERYDRLRRKKEEPWDQKSLQADLDRATLAILEYKELCEEKLLNVHETQIPPEINSFQELLQNFQNNWKEGDREHRFFKQASLIFHRYGSEPLRDILSDIFDGLPNTAKNLNKPTPKLKTHFGKLRIYKTHAAVLKNVFMHCLRNSLDHGIETPEERKSLGKPLEGTINIEVRALPLRAEIHIWDDGKGLDLDRIKEKGIDHGLISESENHSDESLAQLIFHSGLSTAKNVTQISGRGVGMDAISNMVKEKGGSIQLRFKGPRNSLGNRPFLLILFIPITPIR